MRITEIKITMVEDLPARNDRLLGFASIVLDDAIAIRDLRIIGAAKGVFVAFPSKRHRDHCPGCNHKNEVTARFCGWCGNRLADNRAARRPDGTPKLYLDVALPICHEAREWITGLVIDAYYRERDRRDTEIIEAAQPARAIHAA